MDQGLGDDFVSEGVSEAAHLRGKENGYTLKPPESSSLLEYRETVTPHENDYPESSFHELVEIMEGKNATRSVLPVDTLEQPNDSLQYVDGAGDMVEELTIKNYDGSKAIVGTSNNRERMQARQIQWQHLYQISGGSGSGSLRDNNLYGDNNFPAQHLQKVDYPEFSGQKTAGNEKNEVMVQVANAEHKEAGIMGSPINIRTKILTKSGFSEFFVKNTLKGKGIIFRGSQHDGMRPDQRDQNNGKAAGTSLVASNVSQSLNVKIATPTSLGTPGPAAGSDGIGTLRESMNLGPRTGHPNLGVSLRKWLSSGRLKAGKDECLSIFRRIVDLVDYSHSQGVALPELQPSCFMLLSSNQVKYHGSVQRDMLKSAIIKDIPDSENHLIRRRPLEEGSSPTVDVFSKKQKVDQNAQNANSVRHWPQFTTKYGLTHQKASDRNKNTCAQDSLRESDKRHPGPDYGIVNKSTIPQFQDTGHHRHMFPGKPLEEKWYRSPEELSEGICTVSSNIYSLGVLLFELLSRFDSERAHVTAMSDLRHRILPPNFLSENAKEAGFCLWLLHPEPSSRPTAREILQSELIAGMDNVSQEELSLTVVPDDTELELLSHFLVTLKDHKQKDASRLVEDIRCLDKDLEEVERRSHSKNSSAHSGFETAHLSGSEHTLENKEPSSLKSSSQVLPNSNMNDIRLLSNISQLESAYFSMRSKIPLMGNNFIKRHDRDLLTNRENWYLANDDKETHSTTDSLGDFFDGLCKYARYTKFRVCGLLRTADFNNSANVICSLSFDRDLDYFAAAGVSKKIKIFEFNSLFNDSVDIHYPLIEMSNESKLSCICWNDYIKNYLASTGYDGVVKLWDASTGQGIYQYNEHEKRAWSVDFSPVNPTKLASGSDDCSVKLWSINERSSISTIRNIANVCCVQFSSQSTHLLAFGSADYRTYCYDLRNVRTPWCVLAGHEKAVSYVKFLDSETLVTASTDNSLKIWDLNKTNSSGTSTSACSLTLGGHTNEKNFVGLSAANGYITCGSETNEVYSYHRSMPMPIASHKFGSIDPISGRETDDDNGQFVSSVCWRGKSDMVVAANSSGCMKVLQMV